MSQSITDLTSEQETDVAAWLELGMNIMAHYGVDTERSIYENLDATYEAWADDIEEKPDENALIVGLGTVFGDRLNHKHETKWQLVADEHGADFMIEIKGYQIYPIDFVAKRVATLSTEEPEFGFFYGMSAVIDSWE